MKKRNIKYLVVHCTATPQTQSIESIKAFWRNNLNWKNPGYHYIIRADGAVVLLHPEHLISNGVKGFNNVCINISYIGGIDTQGKAIDNRTVAQKKAILSLLKELRLRYPAAIIQGHRDFSPDLNHNGVIEPFEYIKMCPCFDAKEEYKKL